MTRDEIDRIIRRDLPGYRVARGHRADGQAADAGTPPAEATTPELQNLRRKYLVSKYLSGDSEWNPSPAGAAEATDAADEIRSEDDDDIIVPVEPVQPATPWDVGARPKAVVISGRDRRVIGHQG
jgi:hypothetical protein